MAHLRSIRAYLEQFNPKAARDLADALIATGNNLEHYPHRGRPVPGTDKSEPVTAYPYIIRYRVAGDTVRMLPVRQTTRRPTHR